jgi:hypothetical protein
MDRRSRIGVLVVLVEVDVDLEGGCLTHRVPLSSQVPAG